MEKTKYGVSIFGGRQIIPPKPMYIKHKSKFLPRSHVLASIVGGSGSGKSTFLLSIIDSFYNLSQIMVCSLIVGNPVYDSIENYCKDTKKEYFFSSNPIEAQEIIGEMIDKKEPSKWGLIIFDDYNQGRVNSGSNAFTKCTSMSACMLRNYGYNMIFITQSAINIPTIIRNNLNMRVVYRLNNKTDIQSQRQDFSTCVGINPRLFMKLYRTISDIPYSFILLSDDNLYIYVNGESEQPEKIKFNKDDE
jgi:hypothetical protein